MRVVNFPIPLLVFSVSVSFLTRDLIIALAACLRRATLVLFGGPGRQKPAATPRLHQRTGVLCVGSSKLQRET